MSLLSCNLRCQRRSIVGIIPSSAATSVCMRPLVSHSATASRLNSSVNRRFVVLVIIHLLAPRSLSSVSVKSREDQGSPTKPFAAFDRLAIAMVHLPIRRRARSEEDRDGEEGVSAY